MPLTFKKLLFISSLFCFTLIFSQKKSTKSENVYLFEQEFIIDNLNDVSHRVWVYLPPDYDKTKKSYPVIYMHDGQNLFDDITSYIGEWSVDETLNNYFTKTNKGFIVVGIANGEDKRIEEYTPWKHEKYGGGKGSIYVDFIKNELKPLIDKTYRTKQKAKHTAIIGSSLGGLISFYAGLKYPETFGKIGALSTSFWFSENVFEFASKQNNLNKSKIYLLVGGKEGENMVSDTEKMANQLISQNFPTKNLKTKIVPEGKHNETFWKNELLEVITFLYQ